MNVSCRNCNCGRTQFEDVARLMATLKAKNSAVISRSRIFPVGCSSAKTRFGIDRNHLRERLNHGHLIITHCNDETMLCSVSMDICGNVCHFSDTDTKLCITEITGREAEDLTIVVNFRDIPANECRACSWIRCRINEIRRRHKCWRFVISDCDDELSI